MRSATWIFRIAGFYGLVALIPLYFIASRLDDGSHPEWYFGFVGLGLAWQVAFLIIATDPRRYRPMMIAAMAEKFSFAGALLALFLAGRVVGPPVLGGVIDFLLGLLFIWAYRATGRATARTRFAGI